MDRLTGRSGYNHDDWAVKQQSNKQTNMHLSLLLFFLVFFGRFFFFSFFVCVCVCVVFGIRNVDHFLDPIYTGLVTMVQVL